MQDPVVEVSFLTWIAGNDILSNSTLTVSRRPCTASLFDRASTPTHSLSDSLALFAIARLMNQRRARLVNGCFPPNFVCHFFMRSNYFVSRMMCQVGMEPPRKQERQTKHEAQQYLRWLLARMARANHASRATPCFEFKSWTVSPTAVGSMRLTAVVMLGRHPPPHQPLMLDTG